MVISELTRSISREPSSVTYIYYIYEGANLYTLYYNSSVKICGIHFLNRSFLWTDLTYDISRITFQDKNHTRVVNL